MSNVLQLSEISRHRLSGGAPELPDLRRVGTFALDTETNDAGLRADRGSSWAWAMAMLLASALHGAPAARCCGQYIPLRHPDTDNFDPAQVYRWVKDMVASPARIVTMNGVYDFGWMGAEAAS